MNQEELCAYFAKINLDLEEFKILVAQDKVIALSQLYFAHVKSFPYSNFEIREAAHQFIGKRNTLTFFNHAQIMNQGGYCFQTNALLHSVLEELGFSSIFCEARGLIGQSVNNKNILNLPATHVVLMVTIDKERYLLEPAMGMQSPRYPILVRDSKTPIIQDKEQFLFYKYEDVFVLKKNMRGFWFTLMQTSLKEASKDSLERNLLQLERFPQALPIRDKKTLVAVITDKGSKSLFWEINKQLKFMREEDGNFTQKTISDWTEGCKLLKDEFSIETSPQELKKYCSPLPKPIRPWEINLPIRARDLDLMEENLTYSP